MMYWIIALLLITNCISLWLFLRAKFLNQKIYKNIDLIDQYLRIHSQLERAGSATLTVKKLHEDGIMYREPM